MATETTLPELHRDDLLPQTVAGRYAVETALGHGGVGTVYSVIDTTTFELYAQAQDQK